MMAEHTAESLGVIGLAVGEERYAVPLEHVVAIEPVDKVTPVPGTPAVWAGLANIRGAITPVMELREYLGVKAGRPGTVVVVAATSGVCVGLLCDEASDVRWIGRSDVAAPPAGTRALRGVTRDLVAILDVETLVADPSLVVDDED